MSSPKVERVIAYVDGFNLYFGLKDSGFERYFWLNLESLILELLKPGQQLVQIKYFTSLVTNNVDKRLRQKKYIQALSTVEKIKIIYGAFQQENNHCNNCGQNYYAYCEKMTDVNIATHLLNDHYNDDFDMAMLVSGDTDLIPPIRLINEGNSGKRVFVAFPPNRSNEDVKKFAKGSLVIGRKKLADSQFPDDVLTIDHQTASRPITWA